MIARIQGILDTIDRGSAFIRIGGDNGAADADALSGGGGGGGLTYEVLLPGYTAARLGGSIGRRVTLHTLYWVEATSQGATMHPRLAGFASIDDRRFFELFTTCKGIGNRKALRAMTLSTAQIAAAIADRDVSLLKTLPEIGARTAETIVATLHGKVDAFLSAEAFGAGETAAGRLPTSSAAREAVETLLALGEIRTQVVAWVDRALRELGGKPTADELVRRAYQIKSGG
jgi:Holliday junction DNA helicase RuvA